MRKVTKTEFLAMPEGTVYFAAPKGNNEIMEQSGLRVKGETIHNIDFFYTPLDCPHLDTDEMIRVNDGEEVIMPEICSYRDGMFDDDAMFYVLTKDEAMLYLDALKEAVESLINPKKQ